MNPGEEKTSVSFFILWFFVLFAGLPCTPILTRATYEPVVLRWFPFQEVLASVNLGRVNPSIMSLSMGCLLPCTASPASKKGRFLNHCHSAGSPHVPKTQCTVSSWDGQLYAAKARGKLVSCRSEPKPVGSVGMEKESQATKGPARGKRHIPVRNVPCLVCVCVCGVVCCGIFHAGGRSETSQGVEEEKCLRGFPRK